LNINPFC